MLLDHIPVFQLEVWKCVSKLSMESQRGMLEGNRIGLHCFFERYGRSCHDIFVVILKRPKPL